MAQGSWQTHYQIWSVIFLKEFMKLNLSMKTMTKNVKFAKLNISKYCNCLLEYINYKDDSIEYKCLCCNKNYQKKFDGKLKEQFFKGYLRYKTFLP